MVVDESVSVVVIDPPLSDVDEKGLLSDVVLVELEVLSVVELEVIELDVDVDVSFELVSVLSSLVLESSTGGL